MLSNHEKLVAVIGATGQQGGAALRALQVSSQFRVRALSAIEAHGGLDRGKRFTTLSVHGINGDVLWGIKGKGGVLDDVTIMVDLRDEKPFGSPDRRSRLEPQRVAIENANGKVLEELLQLRRLIVNFDKNSKHTS